MAETQHFRFPLPDPLNYADEDAERIRQAILGVDVELHHQRLALEQALETVDGTLQTARKDIDAALGATERRVSIALENQQTEVSGKLRLMRLHRMLGLEL